MEYDYEAVLTSDLIDNISVIVCEPSVRGRKPNEMGSGILRNVLSEFYDEYYQDGLGPTELPRSCYGYFGDVLLIGYIYIYYYYNLFNYSSLY